MDGTLEGTAKEFDSTGKVKREGRYSNNAEDGEWKEYEDSVLVKRIIYKNGRVVKEIPVRKKQ